MLILLLIILYYYSVPVDPNIIAELLNENDANAEKNTGILESTSTESSSYHTLQSSSQYLSLSGSDAIRSRYPNCPKSCEIAMKDDEWCNSQCYNEECGYDGNDCTGWCAPDCKPGWVGDGYCDLDCFRIECEFDKNDCDNKLNRNTTRLIASTIKDFDYKNCMCPHYKINNEHCDWECNVEECNYDDGDCDHQCAEGCWSMWLGDDQCDPMCLTDACGFDKGDCKECSENCRPDKIGNGICDVKCMNADCHWDMGDCAGICKAYPIDYDKLPFQYNACRREWLGDGVCDCNCYNNECNWDNGDCKGMESQCRRQIRQNNLAKGEGYP